MGLLTFAGRLVLVVVNIIFLLAALALVIGGFILRFASDVIDVEEILSQLNSASSSLFGEEVDTSNLDLGIMISALAIAMIVVGVFLLAISFIGCCSACYNFTTLMLVYAIILIVLLVAQLAVVILIYAVPNQFKDMIKTTSKETLVDYEGLRGTSTTSLGWNWVSRQYKCCGAENYHDFENKGNWKGNTGKPDGSDVVTPIVCCKNMPTDNAQKENCAGKDGVKGESDISPNSNLNKGCVEEAWRVIVTESDAIFVTVFAVCVLAQIVLIFFAILGYKNRGVAGGLV
ncbi:cd63 antigen [Mactra antiquata]